MITVGSSDVASILGLSPWGSPAETWARLIGLVPRYSSGDTPATRRGHILESALRDWYATETGLAITPGPPIPEPGIIDPVHPWRHARPDGTTPDGIDVEIKTTRAFGDGWTESDADGIDCVLGDGAVPAYYEAQLAWQLLVMRAPAAHMVAMAMTSDEIRVYRVARDEAVIAAVAGLVEAWMQAHVWTPDPMATPPLGAAPGVLAKLHPGGSREWADATDADVAAADELRTIRAKKLELAGREAALVSQLCERIGDAYGIKGIARWSERKGSERLDGKGLRAAHPDIYREFVRTGDPGRTFALLED